VDESSNLAALDKLKMRIQALRAKTIDNGCTEDEALSAAAKVVKTFGAEFDRLKIHFGYLNNQRLEQADLMTLADLPSIEVLRSKFLGLLSAPATKLVTLLNTPATQLAQVLKARAEKLEKDAPVEPAAPAAA